MPSLLEKGMSKKQAAIFFNTNREKPAEEYLTSGKSTNLETGRNSSIINSPIQKRNSGAGKPSAIVHFNVDLNPRQQILLDGMPENGSRIIIKKSRVSMTDLSAMTAKTGEEFAMFTNEGQRMIVRGDITSVDITVEEAKKLSAEGYRFSGHAHPGTDKLSLIASKGDEEVLKAFGNKTSVIYNSLGEFQTYYGE